MYDAIYDPDSDPVDLDFILFGHITKGNVEKRITDWRRRLKQLYDTVEQWLPDEGFDVQRTLMPQALEEPMRRFGVSVRGVPVLTISSDKRRVVFQPNVIWIIGAKGRVNITSNQMAYTLVDGRIDDGPSQWRLVVGDIRKGSVPFDEHALEKVLRGRP